MKIRQKSKDKDPVLEKKFFDFLFPIIFPSIKINDDIFNFCKNELAEKYGLLTKSTLLEVAISVKKNLERYDTEGQDYVDGSDAKTASVRWSNEGKSYGAPITSVHNKKGLLRCLIYERRNDKFYYFLIPHDAYKHITSTSNIEIPFDVDTGNPRRDSRYKIVNWWDFEVSSFDEILNDSAAEVKFHESYLKKISTNNINLRTELNILVPDQYSLF